MEIRRQLCVVDDDHHARSSLVALLKSRGHEVQAFHDPKAFLAVVGQFPIDCLLLDLRMPELDGADVQRYLLENGHLVPTIILTAFGDVPTTVEVLRLGALNVVEKPYDPRMLMELIETTLSEQRSRTPMSTLSKRAAESVKNLSPKEREVCMLMLAGRSAKEVAFELDLSSRTAQLHRSNVLQTLGLQSHVQLVQLEQILRPLLDDVACGGSVEEPSEYSARRAD